MGEVFEATHERLSHRYAVKLLHPGVRDHPEALPRFMREAQVTSRLRHPGIVAVVDFNTLPGGTAYLVMEYLEGESLGTVLARTGPLPLARVVDIADQLSSALTAAHLQGVVHRDMHPQNVFVLPATGGQSERIKVLDFGISKIASISQKITGMAAVMGTPQYMSPEQAEGKTEELDAASDQFSLAAIVYEMLTGRPAFKGQTLASVAYQIVHARPTPIRNVRPELPVEIENVVSRALAKNKKERFPSVSEFAVHLRWTATLPAPQVAPRPGADPNAPTAVATDTEETTAVSALPSGMAAVLRETSGLAPRGDALPTEAGSPEAGSVDNELTVVSPTDLARELVAATGLPAVNEPTIADPPPRRRGAVIAAAVAGGILVIAVGAGLAARARRPPAEATTAVVPAIAPAAPAVVGVPPPAGRDEQQEQAAAAPAPAAPDPPDPPPPEAAGTHRVPARTRSHAGGDVKGPATAGQADPEVAGGPGQCRITVGTYPWSELWVDGADTGLQTPVVGLSVACGQHRLEFKRRDLKIDQIESVTLSEGREFKRQYELQGAGVDD
jgi:serine/threonine-protein kinase